MMQRTTRADDERLLAALLMRYDHAGTDEIALRLGMSREGISTDLPIKYATIAKEAKP